MDVGSLLTCPRSTVLCTSAVYDFTRGRQHVVAGAGRLSAIAVGVFLRVSGSGSSGGDSGGVV